MTTTESLPSTIQIRPSRLAGLLVAVATLTGVTTWSASEVTTEARARSNTPASLIDHTAPRSLGTRTSQRPGSVLNQAYADGGAGAFIAPAHANGVYGAGGPLAAIGGAGAFIPFTPPES